ncbi:hypothetical protein EI77_01613 [Prosthecobacter fusiformis]|uniref:Uncharacterized protein n=1 Tax=Prosthecobacter fusiformis TaxID=48464 RepID=A0A4R7S6R7_9BACT|nr:hypothetical protein [Prosthecobacter fusiformis]TDU73145.1 hypothetical protein EI77_01613 [Prosthecobacter fusiformis]
MSAKIAKCGLCDEERALNHSHVVPDLFIKLVESDRVTGAAGQTKPHVILATTGESGKKKGVYPAQRGSWESKIGIKEYLFCAKCESKLSVWETYARDVLYGNSPAPCPKLELGVSIIDRVDPRLRQSAQLHDLRSVKDIEYKKFKLFQLSLLFRAGIANAKQFSAVNLGDKHIQRLRGMLLNDDPGDVLQYPCMMISLIEGSWSFEDLIMDPVGGRDKIAGLFSYHMTLGGYIWIFEVSSHKASSEASYALNLSGDMLIPVMSGARVIQRALSALPMIDGNWRSKML